MPFLTSNKHCQSTDGTNYPNSTGWQVTSWKQDKNKQFLTTGQIFRYLAARPSGRHNMKFLLTNLQFIISIWRTAAVKMSVRELVRSTNTFTLKPRTACPRASINPTCTCLCNPQKMQSAWANETNFDALNMVGNYRGTPIFLEELYVKSKCKLDPLAATITASHRQ